MNATITGIASIGILITPLLSFAQAPTHLTRAQVRAELIQLQKAGYNPGRRDDATYPDDIQAAEVRIAAQKAAGNLSASGMGSGTGSTSQSGENNTAHHNTSKLFEHH